MTAAFTTENDPNGRSANGGFKVIFPGSPALDDVEKRRLEEDAHRELYRSWKSNAEPPPGTSLASMRRDIETAAGKPLNIRIEVLIAEKDNQVEFFAGNLWKLDRFLPDSKARFVGEAIDALKKFGGQRSEQGSKESRDNFKLCLALLKAEKDFPEKCKAALSELDNDPKLTNLLKSARNTLGRQENTSSETKIAYPGANESRRRDVEYDERDRSGHTL